MQYEHFSVNYAGWSIIFHYKNLCGCGYAAIITKKGKKKKTFGDSNLQSIIFPLPSLCWFSTSSTALVWQKFASVITFFNTLIMYRAFYRPISSNFFSIQPSKTFPHMYHIQPNRLISQWRVYHNLHKGVFQGLKNVLMPIFSPFFPLLRPPPPPKKKKTVTQMRQQPGLSRGTDENNSPSVYLVPR